MLQANWWVVVALIGLSVGCGSSGVEGESPEGSCVASATGSGTVAVTVSGSPGVLVETSGEAMNTLDEQNSPFTSRMKSFIAAGACGTVGLVYLDANNSGHGLLYVDVTNGMGSPEKIDSAELWDMKDIALFYDSLCRPHVIMASAVEGFIEYVREETKDWTRVVFGGVDAALGEAPSGLWLVSVDVGFDGLLRVVANASTGATTKGLAGVREPAGDGEFDLWSFDPPTGTDVFAYAIESGNAVQALYQKADYPCDPCDLGLYWGRLPKGGAFTEEVVQTSVWGPPHDKYIDQPSLALMPDDEPLVAARYLRRAVTGSVLESHLRIYQRTAGEWCFETVASASDGYAGSDGADFTGEQPHLRVTADGTPHVAFHDQTVWHDDNGWSNTIQGQVRHAVLSGGSWTVTTFLKQAGQLESAEILHGFQHARIAVPPDGANVHIAGVRRVWETDSIYNDQAQPITYTGMAFKATVK